MTTEQAQIILRGLVPRGTDASKLSEEAKQDIREAFWLVLREHKFR